MILLSILASLVEAKEFITTEVQMKALRPYQQEAFDLVWNRIEGKIEKQALVVMATGLGKTVLAAALTRRWFSRMIGRVLFLAHTVDILRQARMEFREVLHEMTATGILTGDEFEGLDAHVLFATFQSMQNRLDSVTPDGFGFVIVDEAHHGQAVTYKEVIEHFTPEFLLGMTATPDRHDGEDIRDIFGPEVCSYPIQFGIREEWLSSVEYQLLADNLSIGELREIIRQSHEGVRVSRKQIDATIFLPERTERIVEIVRREQAGGKRTILFCRAIDHLEHVNSLFSEAVPYHSEIPYQKLRECFDAFHGGRIQTLLVIDKFNEGVDIPDAELLVFLRATDSVTLWLQQLGRGLRRTNSKTRVVVLDFVANCNRLLYMKELGLAGTIKTGVSLPDAIMVDTNLDIRFSSELKDLFGLLEFLEVGFYETYEEFCGVLRKLNPPVPKRRDVSLSCWYKTKRHNDPRLPAAPSQFYKCKGWISLRHACGYSYYETYNEFCEAVLRLEPPKSGKIHQWYKRERLRDARLCFSPNMFYKGKGWTRWMDVVGSPFYGNYEEFRVAVKRLGPPNVAVGRGRDLQGWYATERHRDHKLHSTPSMFYAERGWISWADACGLVFYETYADFCKAVADLTHRTQDQMTGRWYKANRHSDPRLHSSPRSYYKGRGWRGWNELRADIAHFY